MFERLELVESLNDQIVALEGRILSAIEKHLDRSKFSDCGRFTDLRTWDYWWDALAWSDELAAQMRLKDWLEVSGDCWMLADRRGGSVWSVSAADVHHLKKLDAYFVPVSSPNICFLTTHEDGLGPWLLRLEDS